MQVPVGPVRRRLPEAAVGRAAVVEYVAELVHHGRQQAFVDVPRWEVRLPEVRVLVVVVQIKLEGLCNLVVCSRDLSERANGCSGCIGLPSLLPAAQALNELCT